MTNLRRLMVVVVAIAMVVTSMATAFGAPLSDISGKKYEDAVNKLVAFKIAAGIDGQFKGEEKLTRAEFATFIVNMMGLGKQAQVDTIFSDATAKDWFSGYVNAVAEAGYMVGADGKFSPDKNVTYGEAITVLMKMLGYAPVVNNKGTWPSNYINRANNIKLTDGVSVSASAAVTRGNLAILLWNTLVEPKLVEGDTYDEDGNPTYKIAADDGKNTLLYANFNEAIELEKTVAQVPLTSTTFDNDKIKFFKEGTSGDMTKAYTVPKGTDPNALLGLEVKYVADKDDNIKCLEVTTDSEYIVNDTVKTYKKAAGGNLDTITFTKLNKAFKADAGIKIYFNGMQVPNDATNIDLLFPKFAEYDGYVWGKSDKASVTAILDSESNYVKFAFITADVSADLGIGPAKDFQFGLVSSVGDTIKSEGVDDIARKTLNEKADLGISKNIVYKNGAVGKLGDIKKGDIIRVSWINDGIAVWAFTPDIKTVKIDGVEDFSSYENTTLVAGDAKYKFGSVAFYSKEAGDGKKSVTYARLQNDIASFVGTEGTKLYLAPSGNIVYFENNVVDSDTLYGVVLREEEGTNAANDSTAKLTIAKPDGSTATYITKSYVKKDVADVASVSNKMISYTLTTKNEMNNVTALDITQSSVDTDNNIITLSNTKKAVVTDETVFINLTKLATNTTAGEIDYVEWDSVKGQMKLGLANPAFVRVAAEDSLAKVVYLKEASFGSAAKYGMVVGTSIKDGVQTIKINNEGTVKEYDVAAAAYASTYGLKGLLVQYSISDNKISITGTASAVNNFNTATGKLQYTRAKSYTDPFIENVAGKVVSVDAANDVIKFNRTLTHNAAVTNDGNPDPVQYATTIKDNVVIYDIRDVNAITASKDLATVTKDMVFVYDRTANVIVIVKPNSTKDLSQLLPEA